MNNITRSARSVFALPVLEGEHCSRKLHPPRFAHSSDATTAESQEMPIIVRHCYALNSSPATRHRISRDRRGCEIDRTTAFSDPVLSKRSETSTAKRSPRGAPVREFSSGRAWYRRVWLSKEPFQLVPL